MGIAALLATVPVALMACGARASDAGNIVTLSATDFTRHSLTIQAGGAVRFVDEPSAAQHHLCLGRDGACHSSASGPLILRGLGFAIQPGQSKEVIFSTPGTYTMTCTIHPKMNLTVTVQ
ncbi:MAG: hypothetical protein IVW57_16530 [Ktedonobacterales bacterium]|nr:hypothetical protein [Ktedonobacterales bacterium]